MFGSQRVESQAGKNPSLVHVTAKTKRTTTGCLGGETEEVSVSNMQHPSCPPPRVCVYIVVTAAGYPPTANISRQKVHKPKAWGTHSAQHSGCHFFTAHGPGRGNKSRSWKKNPIGATDPKRLTEHSRPPPSQADARLATTEARSVHKEQRHTTHSTALDERLGVRIDGSSQSRRRCPWPFFPGFSFFWSLLSWQLQGLARPACSLLGGPRAHIHVAFKAPTCVSIAVCEQGGSPLRRPPRNRDA